MSRLRVLSNSALLAKRRCDERFRLKYLEKLEPIDARHEARDLGSAVHLGLELRDPMAAARHIVRVAENAWPGEQEEVENSESLKIRAAIAAAMVEGALLHWSSWPAAVEEKFEVPLRNPSTGSPSTAHRLGGRWDGLWGGDDPHPTISGDVLLEVKTSSRVGRDYFARLRIDSQPTTYMEGVSLRVGRPVRQSLYRVIRKPGIKRRKGETLEEYRQRTLDRKPLKPLKPRKGESFAALEFRNSKRESERKPLKRRVPESAPDFIDRIRALYLETPADYYFEELVTRTESQMERWRAEVWEEHERILRIERGEMTIRNTGSCLDFGRCDFFDLCTGEVGIEAFRAREFAHPELVD